MMALLGGVQKKNKILLILLITLRSQKMHSAHLKLPLSLFQQETSNEDRFRP